MGLCVPSGPRAAFGFVATVDLVAVTLVLGQTGGQLCTELRLEAGLALFSFHPAHLSLVLLWQGQWVPGTEVAAEAPGTVSLTVASLSL